MGNPDVMECSSCRNQVWSRGDHTRWRAIQMRPDDSFLTWFCCETDHCREAFAEGRRAAAILWGIDPGDVEGKVCGDYVEGL